MYDSRTPLGYVVDFKPIVQSSVFVEVLLCCSVIVVSLNIQLSGNLRLAAHRFRFSFLYVM